MIRTKSKKMVRKEKFSEYSLWKRYRKIVKLVKKLGTEMDKSIRALDENLSIL